MAAGFGFDELFGGWDGYIRMNWNYWLKLEVEMILEIHIIQLLTNLTNSSMNYTLKSFNTGQITLPKKWRDRVGTTHFIAEERPEGLLVRPLKTETETVYYENEEGFGVYFPS